MFVKENPDRKKKKKKKVLFHAMMKIKKEDEVNIILEELCKANNYGMISHRNINPKRHLDRSRLHLNDAGVSLFVRNFRDFLNNFDKI